MAKRLSNKTWRHNELKPDIQHLRLVKKMPRFFSGLKNRGFPNLPLGGQRDRKTLGRDPAVSEIIAMILPSDLSAFSA